MNRKRTYGDQRAELLGAAAVVGAHDQAADLGGAVVRVARAQHAVDEVSMSVALYFSSSSTSR